MTFARYTAILNSLIIIVFATRDYGVPFVMGCRLLWGAVCVKSEENLHPTFWRYIINIKVGCKVGCKFSSHKRHPIVCTNIHQNVDITYITRYMHISLDLTLAVVTVGHLLAV